MPSGKIKKLKSTATPIFNKKGKVTRLRGVNIDITDLAEYENKLEELIQQKDHLFRELHHRVKNNLQMVVSLLYIKETSSDNATLNNFIKETSTKIQSIASSHEQLLQLQKVETLDIKD